MQEQANHYTPIVDRYDIPTDPSKFILNDGHVEAILKFVPSFAENSQKYLNEQHRIALYQVPVSELSRIILDKRLGQEAIKEIISILAQEIVQWDLESSLSFYKKIQSADLEQSVKEAKLNSALTSLRKGVAGLSNQLFVLQAFLNGTHDSLREMATNFPDVNEKLIILRDNVANAEQSLNAVRQSIES